jgi:hypothetical protein
MIDGPSSVWLEAAAEVTICGRFAFIYYHIDKNQQFDEKGQPCVARMSQTSDAKSCSYSIFNNENGCCIAVSMFDVSIVVDMHA